MADERYLWVNRMTCSLAVPFRRGSGTTGAHRKCLARIALVALSSALLLTGLDSNRAARADEAREISAVPSEPVTGAEEYRLAAGDRLAITIFGQPELSGDFMVDGAGNLLLPLIGAIPATDATIDQIEERVTRELGSGFIQDPKVSIRINELRPIYILGDVRAPGSYPYRFGMGVLNAVALAGGLSLDERQQVTLKAEILQSDERVRVLESAQEALMARRARLLAQRNGAPEPTFPPELTAGRSAATLKDLLEGEREIFALQRQAQAREVEILRDQEPRVKSEIQALREQRRMDERQLALVRSQVEDIAGLVRNGLARRANLIELQREEARVEGGLAKYAVDIAKAEQALGDIALRIEDVEKGYRRRVLTELQDVHTRLMEVETSLSAAREARSIHMARANLLPGVPAANSPRESMTIVRSGKDGMEIIEADEATLLKPGDIVRIDRNLSIRERTASSGEADALGRAARVIGADPAPVN